MYSVHSRTQARICPAVKCRFRRRFAEREPPAPICKLQRLKPGSYPACHHSWTSSSRGRSGIAVDAPRKWAIAANANAPIMKHSSEHTGTVRLIVRAPAGCLRIIPVWQAVGQCSMRALSSRVRCSAKENVDELTLVFDSVSYSELRQIALQISAQPGGVKASIVS